MPDRSRRLARTYRIACYCLQAVCDKNLVFKECQEPYVHTFQWRSVIARAGRAPRRPVRGPTSHVTSVRPYSRTFAQAHSHPPETGHERSASASHLGAGTRKPGRAIASRISDATRHKQKMSRVWRRHGVCKPAADLKRAEAGASVATASRRQWWPPAHGACAWWRRRCSTLARRRAVDAAQGLLPPVRRGAASAWRGGTCARGSLQTRRSAAAAHRS